MKALKLIYIFFLTIVLASCGSRVNFTDETDVGGDDGFINSLFEDPLAEKPIVEEAGLCLNNTTPVDVSQFLIYQQVQRIPYQL